jgi:hypothetical protein
MRSPCCLCAHMCIPPVIARQRLDKHVSAATSTHAAIEELLDPSFALTYLTLITLRWAGNIGTIGGRRVHTINCG